MPDVFEDKRGGLSMVHTSIVPSELAQIASTWYPAQWCTGEFVQDTGDGLRGFCCDREQGHHGPHDSRLAQERRYVLPAIDAACVAEGV